MLLCAYVLKIAFITNRYVYERVSSIEAAG